MKFENGNRKLGLSDKYKFGIELEAFNTNNFSKDGLYSNESKDILKNLGWKLAGKNEEALVNQGGAECVSGILKDTEEVWENLEKVCNHMKKFPGKHGDKVVADEKCGCHVHFDAGVLEHNSEMMKNFKILWAESEELIYKMCNAENDPIREGAINAKFNILAPVSSMFRKGMASPNSKKLMKQINEGTLKVSYKNFNFLKEHLIEKYKLDERRYEGLNLTNIGSNKKNTIEFRMSNGTLKPDVVKQNVYLYASVLEAARQMTLNPEKKKTEFREFFKIDISEEQKVDALLNYLFENEEDKAIYKNRWNSVKDAKVFRKNDKKGFAKNRFIREDMKEVAEKIPFYKTQETMNVIKRALILQDKMKREEGLERC